MGGPTSSKSVGGITEGLPRDEARKTTKKVVIDKETEEADAKLRAAALRIASYAFVDENDESVAHKHTAQQALKAVADYAENNPNSATAKWYKITTEEADDKSASINDTLSQSRSDNEIKRFESEWVSKMGGKAYSQNINVADSKRGNQRKPRQ